MIINPSKQHGTSRRAGRRNVEIGETHALRSQAIQARRSNFAAEGPDIAEAPVVCHQHDDIRSRRCMGVNHREHDRPRYCQQTFSPISHDTHLLLLTRQTLCQRP
ncbi:hypothetical protein D3C85_1511730 [compost metagenome]